MGNKSGLKWNKGGAKRRNTLRLEVAGFAELVTELGGLEGDVKKVVTNALEQAGETIADDTQDAVNKKYLPAQGAFSKGETEKSIVVSPQVMWSGNLAEIGVGFDYGSDGAGGFLISGTPRMQPDRKLEDIYTRKKYMKRIQQDMEDVVLDAIQRAMEGRK